MAATTSPIDYKEFARFVISGGIAATGNLCAVWIARDFLVYKVALLCGIATGMTMSFIIGKVFAFRVRSLAGMAAETTRWLIVYGVGATLYWAGALLIRAFLRWQGIEPVVADMGGAFCGAGMAAFSNYFGHRFFTYRTHRRV